MKICAPLFRYEASSIVSLKYLLSANLLTHTQHRNRRTQREHFLLAILADETRVG